MTSCKGKSFRCGLNRVVLINVMVRSDAWENNGSACDGLNTKKSKLTSCESRISVNERLPTIDFFWAAQSNERL